MRSESYAVVCEKTNDTSFDREYEIYDDYVEYKKHFTYDYSDYIGKELNYDIYLKMLN